MDNQGRIQREIQGKEREEREKAETEIERV